MYSISLSLRDSKSKTATSIFLLVSFKGRRVKISTKEKILPYLWQSEKNRVTHSQIKLNRQKKLDPSVEQRLKGIQNRLDNLVKEVGKYFLRISAKGHEPDHFHLKDHLLRFINPNFSTIIFNDSITTFLKVFINEALNGTRKKANGRSYKESSVICYSNLLSTITKFEKTLGRKVQWQDVNKKFYYSFIKWHEDRGYSINYIGRHLKDLKSLMRMAFDERIHSNEEFKAKYFAVPKEVIKKIPLSMEEVERLLSLDLKEKPYMELSRNIFALGVFLGLRISDLKQISQTHLHNDSCGVYIKIRTIKTGAEVRIPLNSIAVEILKKYGNKVPKFNEQVINRNLKLLAHSIGLSQERAMKLSLHYSRATFCKLAYEMGIPSLVIMAVSGHSSEMNFLRYINISPEEAVREFRKHDFFK